MSRGRLMSIPSSHGVIDGPDLVQEERGGDDNGHHRAPKSPTCHNVPTASLAHASTSTEKDGPRGFYTENISIMYAVQEMIH